MKKVLLATTALALSAGVAYAEVSISGNARMGLQINDGDSSFEKRMTIDMKGSAETDSGLTFGAKLRVRSGEGGTVTGQVWEDADSDGLVEDGEFTDVVSGQAFAGARVYMQAGGVEVAVGNIDGALENMPGMYSASVGLTGLGWAGVLGNTDANGDWGWDAYSSSGNGAEGVEVVYSTDAITAHLSYSDADLGSAADRTAAYVSYTMGGWTVAAGMQESATAGEDKTIVTVGGNVGTFNVGVGYADNDGEAKIALNGSATFGATTVSVFVANEESAAENAMGLGVSHDLGGAKLVAGVSQTEVGVNRADLGVSFSF